MGYATGPANLREVTAAISKLNTRKRDLQKTVGLEHERVYWTKEEKPRRIVEKYFTPQEDDRVRAEIAELDDRIKRLMNMEAEMREERAIDEHAADPCPFCGSTSLRIANFSTGLFGITCMNATCEIRGPYSGTRLGAVNKWNARIKSK